VSPNGNRQGVVLNGGTNVAKRAEYMIEEETRWNRSLKLDRTRSIILTTGKGGRGKGAGGKNYFGRGDSRKSLCSGRHRDCHPQVGSERTGGGEKPRK